TIFQYEKETQECSIPLLYSMLLPSNIRGTCIKPHSLLAGLKQFNKDAERSRSEKLLLLIENQPLSINFIKMLEKFTDKFSGLTENNEVENLLKKEIFDNKSIFKFLNKKITPQVVIQFLTYFHQDFFSMIKSLRDGLLVKHSENLTVSYPKGKTLVNISQRKGNLLINSLMTDLYVIYAKNGSRVRLFDDENAKLAVQFSRIDAGP